MSEDDRPEPDRIEGAPHPRQTDRLFGQAVAETEFLSAFNSGRLHHGWLLTGPRGVGKATLAWRIARFLLATPIDEGGFFAAPPPQGLSIADDHPVSRRIGAGAEPRLFALRRAWDEEKKRLKTVITVDEVRRLKGFFQLSAVDGGRRVAIVDSADEMNPSAANALLKILEEPPKDVTLLLVSNQPSGLLPTIRSRCRTLRLGAVGPADLGQALVAAGTEAGDNVALAELAGGSVGEAVRLVQLGGIEAYREITGLFAKPGLDRRGALRLADSVAGRGAETRFELMLALFDLFLARLARSGIHGFRTDEAAPGEMAVFARMAPDMAAGRIWADLHQSLGARLRHGRAVNLDPAALLLDTILKIDEAATREAARREGRPG